MFKRKKISSAWAPKTVIVVIVSFVLLFVIVGLLLALAGAEMPSVSNRSPGLGEIGARCGGPSILPCKPGTVCSVPPERWATEEGVCVRDTRPAPNIRKEGEACNLATDQCEWGFVCSGTDANGNGTCTALVASQKGFIMAVIPEGMELVKGSYKAPIGTKIAVRVRAVNVNAGALYLKPMTASYAGVHPADKVSDLTPVKDAPNEYEGSFTVSKNLGADLIAVMQGMDGQDVTLGVNVAAAQ